MLRRFTKFGIMAAGARWLYQRYNRSNQPSTARTTGR